MKIIKDFVTILEADENYILTNEEGVYAHTVYLAINDDPSNWHEIPESEVPQDNE